MNQLADSRQSMPSNNTKAVRDCDFVTVGPKKQISGRETGLIVGSTAVRQLYTDHCQERYPTIGLAC